MSSLLRDRPSLDAVAAVNPYAASEHARDSLERRLAQLETEHAAFTRFPDRG